MARSGGVDRQQGANAWLTVSLREGKNREIRKVMESGCGDAPDPARLGPFQLGALPRGEVEEVNGKILREQVPGLGNKRQPRRAV